MLILLGYVYNVFFSCNTGRLFTNLLMFYFDLKVQEYVEAATFCNFCKTGGLLDLNEINASLMSLSDPSVEPLKINVLDYFLGVIF